MPGPMCAPADRVSSARSTAQVCPGSRPVSTECGLRSTAAQRAFPYSTAGTSPSVSGAIRVPAAGLSPACRKAGTLIFLARAKRFDMMRLLGRSILDATCTPIRPPFRDGWADRPVAPRSVVPAPGRGTRRGNLLQLTLVGYPQHLHLLMRVRKDKRCGRPAAVRLPCASPDGRGRAGRRYGSEDRRGLVRPAASSRSELDAGHDE